MYINTQSIVPCPSLYSRPYIGGKGRRSSAAAFPSVLDAQGEPVDVGVLLRASASAALTCCNETNRSGFETLVVTHRALREQVAASRGRAAAS